jgi:hypothetical protein
MTGLRGEQCCLISSVINFKPHFLVAWIFRYQLLHDKIPSQQICKNSAEDPWHICNTNCGIAYCC